MRRRERSGGQGGNFKTGAFVGSLLAVGSMGTAHAAGALVEGMSDTPEDAQFVNIRYRCDGPSCRFEAVLDGVSREDVTEYEWRFGDGRTLSGTSPIVTHDWTEPGSQDITLMVHDQYCDPLVAEATFSTLASSTADGTGSATEGATLTASSVRLGQDSTRTVSEPLGGNTVSGKIFVFAEAPKGTTSVAFRLVGPAGTRNLRLEKVAPFDLAGGSAGSARPFDTRSFIDGEYRLDVTAGYAGGRSENVSVAFGIRNEPTGPLAEGPSGQTPGDSPADGPDAPAGTDEPTMGAGSPDEPDVADGAGSPDEPDVSDSVATALVFSTRSDRANGESLAGAVIRGQVYPYLDGAKGADSVRFFLDDPNLGGEPLQVEGLAPWDVMGGSATRARPLDTRDLSDGRHILSAEVTDSGNVFMLHAVFTVVGSSIGESAVDIDEPTAGAASPSDEPDASGEAPATLVFSTRPDRTRGQSLADAVVRDEVYLYLKGAEEADSVQFFLDDPTLQSKPLQIEGLAPWDVMGGSVKRARPLDTRRLSDGGHVLSAKVFESGNWFVVHADFTVAD